jgi:transcriptional regulator with XRE-family HTH domain
LALSAGLSQNLISYIETGKISPSATTIFKICNTLGINPGVLFDSGGEERIRAKEAVLDLVSRFM